MLPRRSILFMQICLLLINGYQCQNYEAEYDGAEGEGNANDDSGVPDYSAYYASDNSAPLAPLAGADGQNAEPSSGFVPPFEYHSFFGPSAGIEFGASNKKEVADNPFAPKQEKKVLGFVNIKEEFPEFHASGSIPADYFQPAKKKLEKQVKSEPSESRSAYESRPGPSYVSQKLPRYPLVDAFPHASGNIPKVKTPYQKYSFQPIGSGAISSPYKPKYLSSLLSTAAPYNPTYSNLKTGAGLNQEAQASESVVKRLDAKNCKRIKKHVQSSTDSSGRSKREAMDCYVCENPENKSKFTECAFAAEPSNAASITATAPSALLQTTAFPLAANDGYRFKRFLDEEYGTDPYEYIKSRSMKMYEMSKPGAKKKQQGVEGAESYNEEYTYDPEEYEYTGPDKSFSEQQGEEVAKNPENCVKEERDGMVCTVCKDSKGAGNFEQCSYSSDPKEEKYAYTKEKKYDSNDEPSNVSNDSAESRKAEDKAVKTEPKKAETGTSAEYGGGSSAEYGAPIHSSSSSIGHSIPKKAHDTNPYAKPHAYVHKGEKINPYTQSKTTGTGLDSAESTESESTKSPYSYSVPKSPYSSIADDYHFKFFPEYANEETKQTEIAQPQNTETSRKDVAEVLAEFSKKDRSTCKKAEKNGMTCYLCVDQKGIQHEECMYVSESKPQASHVAYHELQQIKSPNKEAVQAIDGQTVAAAASEISTTTLAAPAVDMMLASASGNDEIRVKYNKSIGKKHKKRNSGKKSNKNSKKVKEEEDHDEDEEESRESEQKTAASEGDSERMSDEDEPPIQFTIDDEEGLYSSETKPVYSKTLGVKLPRYMVEKSEFEKEFDEFAGDY